MTLVVGVDVGGTTTRVVMFEHLADAWTEVGRWEGATTLDDAAVGVSAGLERMIALARNDEIVACGIGVPEYVHAGALRSELVIRLPESGTAEIERVLSASGTSPFVLLESDVRCAATAEWSLLEAPAASMVYVSVGTGLSAALVLPGGICWEGHTGSALALGEWPSPAPPRNLERFASGTGLADRYAAVSGRYITGHEIVASAGAGDSDALRCLTEAGQAIGAAVRNLHAVLDPDAVVVGGGLGSAATPLWHALVHTAETPITGRAPIRVRRARLGDRSGALGAAMLALTRACESS